MKKWRMRRMGSLLAGLLLLVMAGCQSVGGLDVNKAIVNQLDVTSSESSSTFELSLDWDRDALAGWDEASLRMLEWISEIKLSLNSLKQTDDGRVSANGILSLGKGDIPFAVQSDQKTMLIEIGGAKRPIAIDLQSYGGLSLGGMQPDLIAGHIRQLAKKAASYAIGHFPNPSDIEVKRTSVPINGVATDVSHLHAELDGRELGEMIPAFLDSILADEEGLRALLKEFYAITAEAEALWYAEMERQWAEEFGTEEEWAGEEGYDEEGYDEEGYDEVGADDEWLDEEWLDEEWEDYATPAPLTDAEIDAEIRALIDSLKEARQELELAKTDEEFGWDRLFNEGTKISADVYVDSSLQIRKLSGEARIDTTALADEAVPLVGIALRYDEEKWTVNGDVSIPEIRVPRNALTEEELETMQPIRLLRTFDADSVAYDLLKNELEIDDQEVWLSSYWPDVYFYDEAGVLYVPVRETLTGFGDVMIYDHAARSINFYDEATYQDITLELGSAAITVNGESDAWLHPVIALDGVAYAPADELLGQLGATYSFDDSYDEYDRWMVIERDL